MSKASVGHRPSAQHRVRMIRAAVGHFVVRWSAMTPVRRWVMIAGITVAIYVPTSLLGLWWTNTDSIGASAAAWRIAFDGTADMAGFEDIPWVRDSPNGQRIHRLPGPVLWAVPFYWLASLFPLDFGTPPLVPGAIAAAVAGACIIATMAFVFCELGAPRHALAAAGIAALATSTWSISGTGLWTHSVTQVGVALALLAAARGWTARTGLAGAVAIMARPHTAVLPAMEGLGRAIDERHIRPAIGVGVTSAIGLLVLFGYDLVVFGQLFPPSYQGQLSAAAPGGAAPGGRTGVLPNLALSFVSPRRGLFVFSPFLLPLLPGLRAAWTSAAGWVRRAAIAGAAYLVLQAMVNNYDGGQGFFGYRLMLEPLTMWAPLLFLAYTEGIRHRPTLRTAFWVAAGVAVLMQVLGAAVFAVFIRP